MSIISPKSWACYPHPQSFVPASRAYGFASCLASPGFCASNTHLGRHQHLENLEHYLVSTWQLTGTPSTCQSSQDLCKVPTQLRASHPGSGLLSSIFCLRGLRHTGQRPDSILTPHHTSVQKWTVYLPPFLGCGFGIRASPISLHFLPLQSWGLVSVITFQPQKLEEIRALSL